MFVCIDATLSFVTEPQSVTVKSGSGIELVCLTESREADIRWRLNGSPFTSDLTKGIIVRAGQLQITNVTASYVGTYDCVANNSRGAIISQPADVRIAGWSSVIHCLIGFLVENISRGCSFLLTAACTHACTCIYTWCSCVCLGLYINKVFF